MIVGFGDVSTSNVNWQGLGQSPIYFYYRDRDSSPLMGCVMVYPSRIQFPTFKMLDR